MIITTVMPGAFPLFQVQGCAKSKTHMSNCRQVQNMQLHSLARIKWYFFKEKKKRWVDDCVNYSYQMPGTVLNDGF